MPVENWSVSAGGIWGAGNNGPCLYRCHLLLSRGYYGDNLYPIGVEMTDTVRDRLDKLADDIPGPSLGQFCRWLEEIRETGGYGTFTFKAQRGEIDSTSREVKDRP